MSRFLTQVLTPCIKVNFTRCRVANYFFIDIRDTEIIEKWFTYGDDESGSLNWKMIELFAVGQNQLGS